MMWAARRLRTLLDMLTLRHKGGLLLILLLCGFAVMAAVAAAQDDEIFVDPDSPSGREYELPIDRARERAAPSTQKPRSSGGTTEAPLFGSGVEPDGTAPPQAAGDRSGATPRAGTGDRSVTGDRKRDDAAAEGAAAGAGVERRAQAAASDGVSGLAAVVGVGAAVLLVGALVGLLLRRRAAR